MRSVKSSSDIVREARDTLVSLKQHRYLKFKSHEGHPNSASPKPNKYLDYRSDRKQPSPDELDLSLKKLERVQHH